MNLSVPPGLRLFHRGDLDGFFALGLDNMLMLILMSNFCLGFPLYMPVSAFFAALALGLRSRKGEATSVHCRSASTSSP